MGRSRWDPVTAPPRRRVLVPALFGAAVLLLATGIAALGAPPPTPGVVSRGSDAQTWRPVLAGDAVRVQVADGRARLATPREGSAPVAPGSLRGAQRQGFLDLGSHTFTRPVNRLDVPVVADLPRGTAVVADVRGRDDAGRWSEWVPATPGAPAVLDAPARTVALRLLLTSPDAGSPTVRSVVVHADRDASVSRALAPRASYRVFATREGLVGGTTANGHVITEDDRFVALPSRRALDAEGKGDYSVRICAESGRCATVPVWDVGPWNTDDDYWSPQRSEWGDLPQGLPQAQAAYSDGYHGGEDGFGRSVKNPAGIDLADGVFGALGLGDNGWVTVDYLWTGRAGETPADVHLATAESPDAPVTVRAAPSTGAADRGIVGNTAVLDVQCRATGEAVTGSHGSSTDWLRIAGDQYVPAAWVATTNPPPAC